MPRRAAPSAAAAAPIILRRALSASPSSSSSSAAAASSSAVNSILLRSLKEHYLEVSKMTPPPKISPPKPYTIVKGALDQPSGPVLRREYGEAGEEISISVARLANIMPPGADNESDDGGAGGGGGVSESISQIFLHVDISRPGNSKSLQFLCGLYPDAVGIHSVCLRSNPAESGTAAMAGKGDDGYQGRIFQELDENVRDAFHHYIEARGINEKLFPFLQAWLYVKDHRNLIRWFKCVGTSISGSKSE
uniref:Mitochondrial glycoprotein n=1 Tax=Oryza brachyantha TaxID=4533 RepID=J3L4I1_ORYBR